MKTIKINTKDVLGTVSEAQIEALDAAAADGLQKLHNASGEGNDFLGWLDRWGGFRHSMARRWIG